MMTVPTPAPANFNRLPSAQISLSVASGTAPLTVQATAINASDSDGTVTAYYWKSADGQQASGASANFVFAQAGSYLINLLIEDNAGGRRGFTTRVVVASAPCGCAFAHAFWPLGFGHTKPPGLNALGAHITVENSRAPFVRQADRMQR